MARYVEVVCCLVLNLVVPAAMGQCELQKLSAADGEVLDRFGWSVGISGDVVVVGAIDADCLDGSASCGAVYVYRWNGASWVEEQRLSASDQAGYDGFGLCVDVDGGVAIVGAASDNCASGGLDCGSAYVYRWNGTSWVQEQKLTASDAAVEDSFGVSVAMDGDVAVVGANFDECANGASNCGAAYVYRWNGSSWFEEQKLTASDQATTAYFGRSVSVSGNKAIVGAVRHGCENGDSACGAAYVYRWNGVSWVEEQKLTASDQTAEDSLGISVSIRGDAVMVGAFTDACAAGDVACGSVYVYRWNGSGWVEEQKLTASDQAEYGSFGVSVEFDVDLAIVGAFLSDCADGSPNCGSAYLFRWNGTSWAQDQKLLASDQVTGDQLGRSVAVSGGVAVTGSEYARCSSMAGQCGAAYVFVPESILDCNGDLVNDACDIAQGGSSDCQPNGIPDECEADCDDDGTPDNCETDCNANGIADPCEVPPTCAACLDCNSNGIPDECEGDCDGDGTPDDCEADCNANGIADPCEVPPICAACPDCNSNGIPDSCESFRCDDHNPCTTDACHGTICTYTNNMNACDDGSACTLDDVCTDAFCSGIPLNCDDGLFCNGLESCDAVLGCLQGAEPCPPGLACDEETDTCVPPPIPTTSGWGLTILGLGLLTGWKVYFSRHPHRADQNLC